MPQFLMIFPLYFSPMRTNFRRIQPSVEKSLRDPLYEGTPILISKRGVVMPVRGVRFERFAWFPRRYDQRIPRRTGLRHPGRFRRSALFGVLRASGWPLLNSTPIDSRPVNQRR